MGRIRLAGLDFAKSVFHSVRGLGEIENITQRLILTTGSQCLVWMAPVLQGHFDGLATSSGTVLCSAC
jgi:hypothetical protein